MDIDKSKSNSTSLRGSPMDVDSAHSGSNHTLTLQKALKTFEEVTKNAFKDNLVITRKIVLKHFHPDKLPVSLKKYAQKDEGFAKFLNHVFDDLQTTRGDITYDKFKSVAFKHAETDLELFF